MVTVEEAIAIITKNVQHLGKVISMPVEDSLSYLLAEDIFSPINMPPFQQSAMDGYALYVNSTGVYTVIGEVKAGSGKEPILQKGEAVRIFTGAPVPNTANSVIMQEKVKVDGSRISCPLEIKLRNHIRPLGEQVKEGALVLSKNQTMTAAGIGYLMSLGISEVVVYKKPSIGIIVTGDELRPPSALLAYGEIYESNAGMLKNALKSLGHLDVSIHRVIDDYDQTRDTIEAVIASNDLVLITGGISVGDYDFVGKALQELMVEELFYKVKQKPGKPLYFGKMGQTVVFALPGNPASALTCFYVYVTKAIQKMTGAYSDYLWKKTAISVSSFQKKGDRSQFLKAMVCEGEVKILEGQSSAMLQTYAVANALVYMSQELSVIEKGDTVELIELPY